MIPSFTKRKESEDQKMTDENEDKKGWKTHGANEDDGSVEVVVDEAGDDDETLVSDEAGDDDETLVSDEAGDDEEKKKAVEKKPGRAEQRIRQLAREKNDYASKLSEAQKEIADLRKSSFAIQKQHVDNSVSQYDSLIAAKKSALKQAKITGDLDAELAAEDDLRELTISKRVAEAQKEKLAKEEPVAAATGGNTQQPNTAVNLPDELQDWLGENPWFYQNRRMQTYTTEYTNELLAEGLTFTDPEFYQRLDAELHGRFPEQFVDRASDSVQSKNNTSSSFGDAKPKQQVVAGSSRTPVVKKGREVLTREEAAVADRLGIPREKYAARKKADRENRDSSGWVTINRTKR